jgi:hypothetical protein
LDKFRRGVLLVGGRDLFQLGAELIDAFTDFYLVFFIFLEGIRAGLKGFRHTLKPRVLPADRGLDLLRVLFRLGESIRMSICSFEKSSSSF